MNIMRDLNLFRIRKKMIKIQWDKANRNTSYYHHQAKLFEIVQFFTFPLIVRLLIALVIFILRDLAMRNNYRIAEPLDVSADTLLLAKYLSPDIFLISMGLQVAIIVGLQPNLLLQFYKLQIFAKV
jgi:hypothetical protein